MTDSRRSRTVLKRLTLLTLLILALVSGDLLAAPDVRLLIDVSGSMRKNDPHNLRVPALRLVNELLPAGAEAGVWLFAEKTEVLSPPGKVDDAWKRRTRARLSRIHSRGLHTDIEQAIDTAIAGWKGPAGDNERSLILLTDGIVDVSKDPAESAASRERILEEQMAKLKSLGVKVNTVALSDKVDMALMRLLSKETGGWLETATSADALQRVFLHMLEQTAPPTTVPLKGNHFDIDDQVSELTLLAFRPEGSETLLISPSRERISAKALPDGATWQSEPGYDMVTLKHPEAGTWRLKGVQDPDNRVVVVTDLDIAANPVPTAISAGERLTVEVWLTDHGQPVTRKDLLRLLKATAEISSLEASAPAQTKSDPPPAGESEDGEAPGSTPPQPLPPDAGASTPTDMTLDPQTGHFDGTLNTDSLSPGTYALRLVIDGGTFERQTIKRFRVTGPPISIDYDPQLPTEQDPNARIQLTITGEPDLVDPESLLGYLLVQGPEGKESVVEIPKSVRLPLRVKIPAQIPGEYRIKGQLIARTLRGDSIEITPDPRSLVLDFPKPESAPGDDSADETPKPPILWLTLSGYLLGGNVLLGCVLGVTWWTLRHPKTAPPAPGQAKPPAKGKKAKRKRS